MFVNLRLDQTINTTHTFFLTRWEISEVDLEEEAPSNGLVESWRTRTRVSLPRDVVVSSQHPGVPTDCLPDWQMLLLLLTMRRDHRSHPRTQRRSRRRPGGQGSKGESRAHGNARNSVQI